MSSAVGASTSGAGISRRVMFSALDLPATGTSSSLALPVHGPAAPATPASGFAQPSPSSASSSMSLSCSASSAAAVAYLSEGADTTATAGSADCDDGGDPLASLFPSLSAAPLYGGGDGASQQMTTTTSSVGGVTRTAFVPRPAAIPSPYASFAAPAAPSSPVAAPAASPESKSSGGSGDIASAAPSALALYLRHLCHANAAAARAVCEAYARRGGAGAGAGAGAGGSAGSSRASSVTGTPIRLLPAPNTTATIVTTTTKPTSTSAPAPAPAPSKPSSGPAVEALPVVTVSKPDLASLGAYRVDRYGRVVHLTVSKEAFHKRTGSGGAGAGAGAGEDAVVEEDAKSRARELTREAKWIDMVEEWPTHYKHQHQHQQDAIVSDTLKRRVRKGIPASLRGTVWPLLLEVSEIRTRLGGASYYASLLAQQPSTADDVQIRKDLPRVKQDSLMFLAPQSGSRHVLSTGQASLYNVLRAYSVHDPAVGYVQGMDSVAAQCLSYMAEETAFWCLERLLNAPRFRLRGFYSDSMPLALESMYVHARLLLKHARKVGKHLLLAAPPAPPMPDTPSGGGKGSGSGDAAIWEAASLMPLCITYALRWFMLRFALFTPGFCLRVTDIFLLEGEKALHRVALALLIDRQGDILKCNAAAAGAGMGGGEELTSLLTGIEDDHLWQRAQTDRIVAAAMDLPLTRAEIAKYKEEYHSKVAQGGDARVPPAPNSKETWG